MGSFNGIHTAGEHFHTHRKKYLASHTAIAVLFVVLSIIGGSTKPYKASAAAGSLSVLGNNPSTDATGVSPSTTIQFAFNQTPTESTVIVDGNSDGKPDHVQVVPAGGSAITGAITHVFDGGFGAEVYTFTPTSTLSPGTVYTVTLVGGSSGITANAGADYLTTDHVWSFTTGTPDVTPPTVSSGTVSDMGAATHALTTSAPFPAAISNTAPNIQLNFSEHITASTITNDIAPTDGVPDNAYVSYVDATGAVVKIAGTWSVNDGGSYNYINFTPAANLRINTEYTITLTTAITDTATVPNAMAANYVAKFLTSGTYSILPPTIISTTPTNRQGAVSSVLSAVIVVAFDQPINPATTSGNILLYAADGTLVTGTMMMEAGDGSAVRFIPFGGNLLADQTYSVKVVGGSSGIKNVNGVAYTTVSGDNTYWTFHTNTAYPFDITVPMVNIGGSNVTSGMSGVSTTIGSITVPFLETNVMDVSTINATNIYLTATTPGPASVLGTTVSYNYATKTATLGNIPTLTPGVIYTITASGSITDGTGNALSLTTWTFTTASAVTVPVATMTTPTNGATGVSTNTTIVLSFDQAISSPLASPSQIALSKSSDGSNPIYVSSINLSAGNTVATLTPGSALDAGTEYFVVFIGISPASTPGQNALSTGYKHFTTAGTLGTTYVDLSSMLVGDTVTVSQGGTVSVSGAGAGSEVVIPTGLAMKATGWNGNMEVSYNTTVPSGFVSGKVVAVNFVGVSGQPVKLSGAALVIIPLSGFNPTTHAAEVIGSDGVTYVASQCTSQYSGGDKSLVASYTLGNFASGAASAQQCYTYDSNNVYFATNHFSSFVAGPSDVVTPTVPTPAGGGTGSTLNNTTNGTTVTPGVDMTPSLESAPLIKPKLMNEFKDLLTLATTSPRYVLIKQMFESGLMMGYLNKNGERVWNIDGTMTRAEAAVLIARYIGFNDKAKINSAPFSDVQPNTWYASSVAYLKSAGIISGKSTTTFAPGESVYRAEFFKVAVNAYIKLHPEVTAGWSDIMNNGSNTYADVKKSDWFNAYMNLAQSDKLSGIYTAKNSKIARPSDTLSRIEAAAMMSKLMGL
ncbi:MAG: Ig-like domain-containing protein [Candidatus Peregrinibacteria bacterium]|nr:Ig-like domain-containing protein [Candidatus Peregrinibacteria bacterium]